MAEEPKLLGDRYQLGALLGRGGMAEVRHARDIRLNRDVAVKQLRIDLATDPTFQERFRREAQAAAGLNHPNIVAVYDTGDDIEATSGVRVPYIIMELVEGHTLREILRTGRQIQPRKALEFTQGVLEALNYSHKAGIIHRDIKPANVMLTTDGTVKVMDFGIARAVADTSATMTQTAAVIGTAQYLSPEQARGESVDARSDIYSAGCLLYELLVGRPPFTGDSPVSVAYQHVRQAPIPPSHIDPMITAEMDTIVLKALAKDPADRYQSASTMRNDIARVLDGREVLTMPPAPMPMPIGNPAAVTTAIPTGAYPSYPNAAPMATALANVPPTFEAEEEAPKRRVGLWAFIISLAVIALAFGGWFIYNSMNQVKLVNVPSVVEKTQEEAAKRLEIENLIVKVVSVQGKDDSSVGTVTRQDPLANTPVPIGTTVTIEVNIGPSKNTVPEKLIGKKYKEVVRILQEDSNFSDVKAEPDPEEQITDKKGLVTRINPTEGASVALDTPITVYYATGMSPVPDLEGLDRKRAESEIVNAGFKCSWKEEEVRKGETVGVVARQDPTAGSMLDRSKKVTCVIATAPPPPTETAPTTTPATSTSPSTTTTTTTDPTSTVESPR